MIRQFVKRVLRWCKSLVLGPPVGVCSKCHAVVRQSDGHYQFSRYADGIEEIDLYCSYECAPKIRTYHTQAG